MTGKSSPGEDKEGKNKISSVAIPGISFEYSELGILTTKHEILKENHENLRKDYKFLETKFKHMSELNAITKSNLSRKTKAIEAERLSLLKELEKERSEKEECKKEMERKESEIEALRVQIQEVKTAKEKEKEEELKNLLNKFDELKERCAVAESECSSLKSLFDSEKHTGLAQNNVILLSDDSDAEKENPPLLVVKKEIVDVDVKPFHLSESKPSSSEANHLVLSSSSSSSSDELVLVQLPAKRSRDDFNNNS